MDLAGHSSPNIMVRFVSVGLGDALQARRDREARIVELTEVLSK